MQYKDYFEDDPEEQGFFEYLDNISNRDRIRFMEIAEDYSIDKTDVAGYMMVAKREFNPELSAVSNLALDMIDFRDRIRPLARDCCLMDVSRKYQRLSHADHMQMRKDLYSEAQVEEKDPSFPELFDGEAASQAVSGGYSSGEITAESEAAEPEKDKVVTEEAAEVDHAAAAEAEAAAKKDSFSSSSSDDDDSKEWEARDK